MKNKIVFIASVILVVFFAGFLFLKDQFAGGSATPTGQPQATASAPGTLFSVVPVDSNLLVKPHSPMKGEVSAKVTIVEFLDPECEACSATYPMVKKIFEEYKSNIRILVRYMPYHGNSKYVANILEGARAENKYWETLDLLFQTQNEWGNHHNPNPQLIPEILKPLKLNTAQILKDAQAGKYDPQIMLDFEDGKAAGVEATPTFFVNGVMLQELSYEALKTEIENRLK